MANRNEKEIKRKKRSYTVKYSTDVLESAIDALKKKKMSSYEAEKKFGIPRRTLLDKLHNKHPKRPGCPTRLSETEEENTIKVLITAAEYGSPLTLLDLRVIIYRYLEGNGRIDIFNKKLPGKKWAYSFIKRNKSKLTYRAVQNIKQSRAKIGPGEIKDYFMNLRSSLEDVPTQNIINYDETNLSDNPGGQKCLFRRGVKYPERVVNYTKGSISIMFAITAGGECLPPYVVYKAEHLYTQWTVNGPKGCRFNRSKSGWFDSLLFEDWFESIILPWAKDKPGKKILIGDNLASHINYKIVTYCEQNDIRFVFLPPNSSHLTQPLDVCYFGPLKKLWREILLNYKIKNPREVTVNKGHFPDLLKNLVERLNQKTQNIIGAFKTTGIAPFNPDKVINKLPGFNIPTMTYTIDNALLDWLKETRTADPTKKGRNKKLNVPPGKSVSTDDFTDLNAHPNTVKKAKKNKRQNTNKTDSGILQLSLRQNNPYSLKMLCTRIINAYTVPQMENVAKSPSLYVQQLSEITKDTKANMPFIDDLPECLQTKNTKIIITSDVTLDSGPSRRTQNSKKINTSLVNKKGITITRSALHMKLAPTKKDKNTKERKKILKDITQEIKGLQETEKKMNDKTRTRKINRTETKIKKSTLKCKSLKQKKKRSNSYSSLSTDIDMSIADTDDSEYETLDDFITFCQKEDHENIEPLPYGISDIVYYSNDDRKLKTDSWILAKFVTKKSEKHFVGKVISVKNNIPEVKFVRKVKESKLNIGSVFTYPTVEDIYNIKHLDDIIMILPEPHISRRGQIIFNIDLTNYNVQ